MWVGQLFLKIFTICTWTGMGKKIKKSQIWKKKIFLSSSKKGESVGNAKQTIFFIFGLRIQTIPEKLL